MSVAMTSACEFAGEENGLWFEGYVDFEREDPEVGITTYFRATVDKVEVEDAQKAADAHGDDFAARLPEISARLEERLERELYAAYRDRRQGDDRW